MGRPSKGGRQGNVRLDEDELEQLDEWVAELRASGLPGTSGVTRSDLIREAVQAKLRERATAKASAKKGTAKR